MVLFLHDACHRPEPVYRAFPKDFVGLRRSRRCSLIGPFSARNVGVSEVCAVEGHLEIYQRKGIRSIDGSNRNRCEETFLLLEDILGFEPKDATCKGVFSLPEKMMKRT